ncbi:MAG: hypothetical protein V3R24_09115 [Gemmatimonadales bacterium]
MRNGGNYELRERLDEIVPLVRKLNGYLLCIVEMFEEVFAEDTLHRVVRKRKFLAAIIEAVYARRFNDIDVHPAWLSIRTGPHVNQQISLPTIPSSCARAEKSEKRHGYFMSQRVECMQGNWEKFVE